MIQLTDRERKYIRQAIDVSRIPNGRKIKLTAKEYKDLCQKLESEAASGSLLVDTCGCEVLAVKEGLKLIRCTLHEAGPELADTLVNIIDSSSDDATLADALDCAENRLDSILELADKTRDYMTKGQRDKEDRQMTATGESNGD